MRGTVYASHTVHIPILKTDILHRRLEHIILITVPA
jgi:hypothetical protein